MARSSTKIDTPQALSIMFEIHEDDKKFRKKREELYARFDAEGRALVDAQNKQLDENLERLRRELGLTQMIDPVINASYLEQHKIAFVEHGIHEGKGGPRELFEKLLHKHEEH